MPLTESPTMPFVKPNRGTRSRFLKPPHNRRRNYSKSLKSEYRKRRKNYFASLADPALIDALVSLKREAKSLEINVRWSFTPKGAHVAFSMLGYQIAQWWSSTGTLLVGPHKTQHPSIDGLLQKIRSLF